MKLWRFIDDNNKEFTVLADAFSIAMDNAKRYCSTTAKLMLFFPISGIQLPIDFNSELAKRWNILSMAEASKNDLFSYYF